MQMGKKDRHMVRHMGRVMRTSIGTVTKVSIKFVEKESRNPKKWLWIQNRTQNAQRVQHR